MLPATPHRTADSRFDAPTPMIDELMTCVVDTGACSPAAPNSTSAPAVSAQKPWMGLRRMMRWPIVFMMRQPPEAVPSAIAVAHTTMTHAGTTNSRLLCHVATSSQAGASAGAMWP